MNIKKNNYYKANHFQEEMELLLVEFEPQSIDGDTLIVICDKDGTRWHEGWELQHTIWGFERGDYYFL